VAVKEHNTLLIVLKDNGIFTIFMRGPGLKSYRELLTNTVVTYS
jgi:hypothetical protein